MGFGSGRESHVDRCWRLVGREGLECGDSTNRRNGFVYSRFAQNTLETRFCWHCCLFSLGYSLRASGLGRGSDDHRVGN